GRGGLRGRRRGGTRRGRRFGGLRRGGLRAPRQRHRHRRRRERRHETAPGPVVSVPRRFTRHYSHLGLSVVVR
ncbi:hypothetical protein FNH08_44430, partial [Streptomyces spongiae]|nr:hypothetical protein [Streptomyces spongiae]